MAEMTGAPPDVSFGKSFEEKQDEARQILNELYTLYAPHKLKDVDVLLEAYAGQEDDLVASVRQKYVKAAPPPVNNATESPRRGRKSSTTKAVRSRTSSVPASKMEGFGNTTPRRKSWVDKLSIFRRRKSQSHTAAHIGELSAVVGGSPTDDSGDSSPRRSSFTQDPTEAPASPRRNSLPPPSSARRSTSMPPPANRNAAPMSKFDSSKLKFEEAKLEIRNLDSDTVTTAGQINDEVTRKNSGLALRNLRGKDRFISFFQKFDPDEVQNVERMLSHGGMTEDQLWNHLQVKYQVNQRGRLLAILKLFEPHNSGKVDKILQQRNPDEIEELITKLLRKYKPAIEKMEPDPKTWKTGSDNTYQMLPSRDLGD